jgi:hypothetical protein
MKPCLIALSFLLLQAAPPVPRQAIEVSSDNGHRDNPNNASPNGAGIEHAPPAKLPTASKAKRNTHEPTGDNERPAIVNAFPVVSPVKDKWDFAYIIATIGIALITLILACIAGVQARAAKTSAQAIINSERAWVTITSVNWHPEVFFINPNTGACPALNIFNASLKNVGKTPAKIVKISMKYVTLDENGLKGLAKIPEYAEPGVFGDFLLVAQDFITKSEPLKPEAILTQDKAIAVQASKLFLYAYGYVFYKDISGEMRETRRGFLYDFPQGLDNTLYNASYRPWPTETSEYNRTT